LKGNLLQQQSTILVFDSGFGGLSVLKEIVRARPDADYVYVADNAAFPYGNLNEDQLVGRVLELFERLIAEYMPDLAVIACNTASTVVLPHLRGSFSLPFVGTVPAIKPAASASKSRLISVLGTPGTVTREYTHDLIAQFAEGCDVTLIGARGLAAIAEAKLRGEQVSEQDILVEIKPAYVEKDGKRTDQIVLACTHYPLLLDELHKLSPWPVNFVDPAPAIARRVVALIGPPAGEEEGSKIGVFTGAVPQGLDERKMLEQFNLTQFFSMNKPLAGLSPLAM
jgi:glutamate racemase